MEKCTDCNSENAVIECHDRVRRCWTCALNLEAKSGWAVTEIFDPSSPNQIEFMTLQQPRCTVSVWKRDKAHRELYFSRCDDAMNLTNVLASLSNRFGITFGYRPWKICKVFTKVVLHFFDSQPIECSNDYILEPRNHKKYQAKDIMVNDILSNGYKVIRIDKK